MTYRIEETKRAVDATGKKVLRLGLKAGDRMETFFTVVEGGTGVPSDHEPHVVWYGTPRAEFATRNEAEIELVRLEAQAKASEEAGEIDPGW